MTYVKEEFEEFCMLGCNVVYSAESQRFGKGNLLHLQDRRERQARNNLNTAWFIIRP
jgi:hypothetical protein